MRIQQEPSSYKENTEISSGSSSLSRRIQKIGRAIFPSFFSQSAGHGKVGDERLLELSKRAEPILQVIGPILGTQEYLIVPLFSSPMLIDMLMQDLPSIKTNPLLGKIALAAYAGFDSTDQELSSPLAQKFALKYATLGGDMTLFARYFCSASNVHDVDEMGASLLHMSALGGHCAIASVLMSDNQFSHKEKDLQGNTPLHYAVSNGQKDMVSLLLYVYRANVFEPNHRGDTPRDLAERRQNQEILKELDTGAALLKQKEDPDDIRKKPRVETPQTDQSSGSTP